MSVLGKQRQRVFSAIFNRIFFILAGEKDRHESLDEFEIGQDLIFRKISAHFLLFLIGSFSYLQVTSLDEFEIFLNSYRLRVSGERSWAMGHLL